MSSHELGFPILSLKGILSEEEEHKSLMLRRQNILNSNTPKIPSRFESDLSKTTENAIVSEVSEKTHSRSQSFGFGRKEKDTFNAIVGYSGAELEEEAKSDFLQRTFPLTNRGQEESYFASKPVKRKSSFMQYDQIQEKPNKYYSKFPPDDEDIDYPVLIPNFNYMSQPSPSMFSSSASPIFSSFSSSNFPYPSHSGTSAVTSSDNFFLYPSNGIPSNSHTSFIVNEKQLRKNSSSDSFEDTEPNANIFRSGSSTSIEPKSELTEDIESPLSESGPRTQKTFNEPRTETEEQPQKYRKMNSLDRASMNSEEEQMSLEDSEELSHSLTGNTTQLLQNGYVGPEEVGRLSTSNLVLEGSEENASDIKVSVIRHPLQTSQEIKRLFEEEHKSFDSEEDEEDESDDVDQKSSSTPPQRALFEESGYVFKDEILHEPSLKPTIQTSPTNVSATQPIHRSGTTTMVEKPKQLEEEIQKKSASTPFIPHISHSSLLFDPAVLTATEAFLSHLSRSLSVASVPHEKEKEKEKEKDNDNDKTKDLTNGAREAEVKSTTTSFASTSDSQQYLKNVKTTSPHITGGFTPTMSRRTKSWTQSEIMLQSPHFLNSLSSRSSPASDNSASLAQTFCPSNYSTPSRHNRRTSISYTPTCKPSLSTTTTTSTTFFSSFSSSSSSGNVSPGSHVNPQTCLQFYAHTPLPTPRNSKPQEQQPQEREGEIKTDWNGRFQECINKLRAYSTNNNIPLKMRLQVNTDLIHLAQDFRYASSTYGKIIISEAYLPSEKKTIKPCEIGGLAGGDKFVVHNILFKFAMDSFGIFGTDWAAAKVAGHELKGLISYFNIQVKDLCLPLMALVDYRGFRLIAVSVLPVNRKTIVYGSNNYGRTIHNSSEEFTQKLKLAGELLNLKPHDVGPTEAPVRVYSPVDLEGHIGLDSKFYLLDFSRVMPPESPRKTHRMEHLFRLLRPEFVKSYPKPLCPDAFSSFIKYHHYNDHNLEIREATRYLIEERIPMFAEEYTMLIAEARESHQLESFRLTEALHRRGINIRYLGVLRSHVRDIDARSLLLVEMSARVIKNQLRAKLRERMKQLKLPLEEPYRRLVVDYLNLVLGDSHASEELWNGPIKTDLEFLFERSLTEQEKSKNFSLKCVITNFSDTHIDGKFLLFTRIQKMTGLRFSARLNKDLSENRNSWGPRGEQPLDDTDLEEIGVRVKDINVIAHAQGYFFESKGLMVQDRDPVAAKRFFHMSLEKFEEALDTHPSNPDTLCSYACVFEQILEEEFAFVQQKPRVQVQYSLDDPRVQKANKYYCRAITADPHDAKSLFRYAHFLEKCQLREMAEEYYLQSLEADPNNAACLHEYGNFLSEMGHHHLAELFYKKSSENSKNVFSHEQGTTA